MRSLCEMDDSLGDVLPAGLCGLAAFPGFWLELYICAPRCELSTTPTTLGVNQMVYRSSHGASFPTGTPLSHSPS